MTNTLHIMTIQIRNKSPIIKPMILSPHPWRSIKFAPRFYPCRMKRIHLRTTPGRKRNMHGSGMASFVMTGHEPELGFETGAKGVEVVFGTGEVAGVA